MTSKVKYWIRLLLDKTLSVLGIPGFQELIKKLTGRGATFNQEFILTRIDRKLDQLDTIRESHDVRTVHEQGTGWHGVDLIVFYLMDFKIYTTDVRNLLRYDFLLKTVAILNENIDRYEEYKEKIIALNQATELSREEFLHELGVTYYVDENFDFNNISDIDLFYSDSVLQRMKKHDLCKYVKNSRKAASSAFVHYHRVDCNDFLSAGEKQLVSRLYYLTIPERLWEFITSKRLNYQNRLRMPEFRKIFESNDFACDFSEVGTSDDYLRFVKDNRHKIRATRTLSVQEVAVAHFTLLAIGQ